MRVHMVFACFFSSSFALFSPLYPFILFPLNLVFFLFFLYVTVFGLVHWECICCFGVATFGETVFPDAKENFTSVP